MMTEPIIVRSGYNSGEKCHGLTVTRSNITVMSQAFGLAIFSRQLLNFTLTSPVHLLNALYSIFFKFFGNLTLVTFFIPEKAPYPI